MLIVFLKKEYVFHNIKIMSCISLSHEVHTAIRLDYALPESSSLHEPKII